MLIIRLEMSNGPCHLIEKKIGLKKTSKKAIENYQLQHLETFERNKI